MTTQEQAAFDAMLDALYSINEVDMMDDEVATVNIDYAKVQVALDLANRVGTDSVGRERPQL